MAPEKTSKAQSAMEYLMTYGWAIIIILVVLAILYTLNVFTPNSLIGTTCTPNFHYLCEQIVFSTGGTLSFLFGQNTGTTEYNLAFACASAQNFTSGQPYTNGTSPWYYITANGTVSSTYNALSAFTLYNNHKIFVNGLPCFGPTGTLLDGKLFQTSSGTYEYYGYYGEISKSAISKSPTTTVLPTGPLLAVGTPFSGNLWMEYTEFPGAVNTIANPYIMTEVATVSVRVGSGTSPGGTSSSTTSSTTTVRRVIAPAPAPTRQ